MSRTADDRLKITCCAEMKEAQGRYDIVQSKQFVHLYLGLQAPVPIYFCPWCGARVAEPKLNNAESYNG